MVLKTYNKPNRSKPRYFSACDVSRIALQVVDDRGLTPEQVLACIAKNLGFSHISLSREASKPVEASTISLKKTVSLMKVIVEGLIKLSKRYNLSWLTDRLSKLVAYLDILDEAFDLLQPDQAKVDDVVNDNFCKCKKQTGVRNG